jgi:hypothetical protein
MSSTKLTHTQKELLDEPTQQLVEAGFLTQDLKITDNAGYYLRHLAFLENKAKLVARAKEINEENAKKLKMECEDCDSEDDDENK